MSKDELTPEEIEALSGTGVPSAHLPTPGEDQPEVTPEVEPLRSLHALHTQAADRFAESLSTVLRSTVEVRFAGLRNQTCHSIAAEGMVNACRHTFTLSPFDGELILDIEPSIIHPLIARLLGGNPCRSTRVQRPLTEIEQRLATRIAELLITQWHEAWANRFDHSIEIAPAESNSRQTVTPPANEPVVTARFDIVLDNLPGKIELNLPQPLIEQLGSHRAESIDGTNDLAEQQADPINRALENSLTEFHVELARTRLAAGELLGLGVGDIITTDQPVDEPLVIDVDGQVKLHVKPGTHEGRKAVQIEGRVDEPS